ncbi:zinc finger protein [Parasponia andersonii]|uniref:Zinc finger protein n=1 Tax=Parasponia andersonii TaxID=3476 RepID=A0A2P5DPR4_PARAD|nr:zinc finger protein [Parasponia andersonii]
MHKLFQTNNGYLYSNLRKHFKNLGIFSPISHFHDLSEKPGCKPKLDFVLGEVEELQSSKPLTRFTQSESESDEGPSPLKAEDSFVQMSHPWPEWVDLMECLLRRGYFEGDRNPFRNGQVGLRESKCIRTACLNFSRDQYNLIRYLSRKDIKVIAECGCPSLDRKVVNSGKRLRAHIGIDEGDTCSSCNLRGDCERAYVKAREDEGGRTVDVMRFLLTYGLDIIAGTVENRRCLNKMVKESVRTLLKETVEYSTRILDSNLPKSMTSEKVVPVQDHSGSQVDGHINVSRKQGDWLCPKCDFLNFAKNIKCLLCDGLFEERLKQLREDQDHLPLKKGDWICDKCNFLNFARNTRCLQCKEKPPKRQINPGEWECPSCNYINFRRNMVCLKCDHKRPKAANSSGTSAKNDLENVGYRENSRLRFVEGDHADVNSQKSLRRHKQNRNNGSHMWRSVGEENEGYSHPNSRSEASGFADFPITGGKSDLSQNAEKRDRWKSEMLERSKGTFKAEKDDDKLISASIQRRLELPKSADDEEMAEWFGPGNLRRKGIIDGPEKFN